MAVADPRGVRRWHAAAPGMTLIEVLVALAIVAFLAVALVIPVATVVWVAFTEKGTGAFTLVNFADFFANELFQRSLHVGKRARSETEIGRGRLSISTAAVELAGQVFDRLEGRQALLLGAGEMAELTAQYLVECGIS